MADERVVRHDDGAAEEAEDEVTAKASCLACGGPIADVLLSLGSIDCHDCRGGLRAA